MSWWWISLKFLKNIPNSLPKRFLFFLLHDFSVKFSHFALWTHAPHMPTTCTHIAHHMHMYSHSCTLNPHMHWHVPHVSTCISAYSHTCTIVIHHTYAHLTHAHIIYEHTRTFCIPHLHAHTQHTHAHTQAYTHAHTQSHPQPSFESTLNPIWLKLFHKPWNMIQSAPKVC